MPCNARGINLIPGPGKSHMLQSNSAFAPQLLSQRSRAHEPQLLKPALWACIPQEKLLQWEACPPQLRAAPVHSNQRKLMCSNEHPPQAKNKINKSLKKMGRKRGPKTQNMKEDILSSIPQKYKKIIRILWTAICQQIGKSRRNWLIPKSIQSFQTVRKKQII